MADQGGLGQAISGISEAVIKPVVDEVGKALEEGVQSVIGTGQMATAIDPVEQQKKKLEEQKGKQHALRVIEWYKQLEASQTKVRQEEQQKVLQRNQGEEQTKKVKQFQVMQKQQRSQQLSEAQKAARKTEIKGGLGG